MILPQDFYLRNTLTVARELLGKTIIHRIKGQDIGGIIVETEAYLDDDDACHASRGMTPRNHPMFEAGGISYVYFIYGMYHCFNVVTEAAGKGCAVLIRALEPTLGLDTHAQHHLASRAKLLTNGPGKLTRALQINKTQNKIALYQSESSITIHHNDRTPDIITTTRIGINKAKDLPYRFYIHNNPHVSKT